MESTEKMETIKAAMEDKKAIDLAVMDLRGKTLITDYFVICTGTSKIHCRAIADGLLEKMKKLGVKGVRSEGYEQGTWILLDYADVVAHVFAEEERRHYNLEDLWKRLNRSEPGDPDAIADEMLDEPAEASALA